MLDAALGFAEAGFPIIPVLLYHEGERWKKQPLREWDLATTNETTIRSWWSEYPSALPAIPLKRTGLVVVDADRRDGIDGVAELPMGPLGPHSRIATPSGGLHLVFVQPEPPITGRFRWCKGVEVLGEACLLTCYDLEELKFPRVAPRAVLPKMFWQARDPNVEARVPQHKDKSVLPPTAHVDGLLEALHKLDPCDWRGEHDEWLKLMTACRYEGIECEDFVRWSTGDPHYYADGPIIRRKWKSLAPKHGGALWAALSARGIKISNERCLYVEVPRHQDQPSQVRSGIDWRHRFTGIIDWLAAHTSERELFSASCLVAEIIAQHQRPKPSVAAKLLKQAARDNGLVEAVGADEVHRTIASGLRWVEEKLLEA